MVGLRLQPEEIHYVDESDFQSRKLVPQQSGRGQTFLSRNISGGCDHDIGFCAPVIASPVPQFNPFGAVHVPIDLRGRRPAFWRTQNTYRPARKSSYRFQFRTRGIVSTARSFSLIGDRS